MTLLHRFPLLLAFGLALLPALFQAAAANERLSIAGTTVSLVPPDGFTPSTQFSGLENKEAGAAVVVVELPPDAYQPLSALFGNVELANANFSARQVTIEKRLEVDTPQGKVPLLVGQQKAGSNVYDKWIALLQGPKTVMITVQSLQRGRLTDGDVTSLIKTVSLSAPASIAERLAALPFKIIAEPPFRASEILMNNTVLLVEGPNDVDPSGSMPIIVVSQQPGGGGLAGKLEAGAEAMLRRTKDMANATIDKREAMTFAGAQGVRLEGSFEEKGLKKRFLQYISVGSDGRLTHLLATAKADGFNGLRLAIEKIAASVASKP